MRNINEKSGFTLIEVIVVLAVVALLIGIATVSLASSKEKTRDTVRKSDIAQVGRFLALGCYLPNSGGGEYDIAQIIAELRAKYPEQAKYMTGELKDPLAQADKSGYKYNVTTDGKHCVLYANLENSSEPVTLPDISTPTMGGASGVFEAASDGWNGSAKYFQMSK